MAKYFKTAFAKNGDRATVPESAQVDGSVSFDQGYGIDYERDQETDPQAKDIGRESFNGLFHDMTEAVGEIQSSGVAQWISGVSYPKGALVWRNKVLHLSIVDANTSAPTSDKWTILYDKSNTTVDKNNFIRAEGSKTTVVTDDITSDKNETSREKVASAELANKKISKENISQTTGNRADYVMSEKAVTDISFGINQKWVDVTSNRAYGVKYRNDTGKTIFLLISNKYAVSPGYLIITVDGMEIINSDKGASGEIAETLLPIANGSEYVVTKSSVNIDSNKWFEWR